MVKATTSQAKGSKYILDNLFLRVHLYKLVNSLQEDSANRKETKHFHEKYWKQTNKQAESK